MKTMIGIALLAAAVVAISLAPLPLLAQACQDEEIMVEDYKKSITDVVETVKKENLQDFERAFHQKNCLTKLTLSVNFVNGLVTCLEKAALDSMATKPQVEAYKAKREKYSRLKVTIEQDRDALKAATTGKEAKTRIEKFVFAD
jgi:hypothetical protein